MNEKIPKEKTYDGNLKIGDRVYLKQCKTFGTIVNIVDREGRIFCDVKRDDNNNGGGIHINGHGTTWRVNKHTVWEYGLVPVKKITLKSLMRSNTKST